MIEDHYLDSFVTTMVEEPTTNARRFKFKKNQEKEKRIIYDLVKENIMSMISLLKTVNECFATLSNLYEKKDPT